ncbi:tRNA modification GTPase [uncultured Polaribacter sp.]|uniref:tRNA modification GTPase n=1 Tax=uncultured Polaribacter sp. TaxID=174711 RepID=UPI0026235519|nr:tRNA modification GTPase [uncultured Polaribacter sp.]
MTKQLTIIFVFLFALNAFSQNNFVNGYYIDNSDKKINCLIKNNDWLNNPTEFKYKNNIDSEVKTLTINDAKEFGIFDVSKYVRHKVDIDRSSKKTDELDNDKNPIFNKEKLFLKALIEGKANLYYYEDKGLVRYFFNKEFKEMKQLISKYYLIDAHNWAINKEFQRQLWNNLKCENISMNSLKKIKYEKSDLTKFFIKYNECHNSEFVYYQKKKKNKDLFHLTLRPGIRSSSLALRSPVWNDADFGNNLTSFRLGVEAEFVFGFNNNKWALLLEPTYHDLNSNTTEGTRPRNINQKSIEVNLGIRHYMYLKNKDVKLFLNALGVYTINFNSQLKAGHNWFYTDKLHNNFNVVLGIGCKYKERFSLELRHLPNRNILINHVHWKTDFQSSSIVLGYTLF